MENKSRISITVLVAALGYFVDIYDLLLFGIVRVASLREIGVPDSEILEVGIRLINFQMGGMLVGGILWGILGDKKGRLSVLFGSILLYSLANIANSFVTTPEQYVVLRFLAGVGLAGELGAAITLVSEMMSKENRGIGTAIVASAGLLGGVFAGIVGDMLHWKSAYLLGGVMGLLLLLLRVKMFESGLFDHVKSQKNIRRGAFSMMFFPPQRFFKYLCCILIGVPVWFIIGILVTFSPELATELGVTEPIKAGYAIMSAYIGLSVGDLSSGLLSQLWRSRKKTVFLFLGLTLLGVLIYVNAKGISKTQFYVLCGFLGFSVGYWAVFVTIGAEQFGTNLRATAATTIPNFVRGSLVPLTESFKYLKGSLPLNTAALYVGGTSIAIALVALYFLQETFGKELNYIEDAEHTGT